MKILHVITSLRIGGAEHLLVDLLPELKRFGFQVDLLLFDGTYTSFYKQLEEKGIKIHSLGRGFYSMYNLLHLFRLKRFMKRYDIIHTHNTPCQLLAAIAKNRKSLLVTTEHNTSNRRRTWRGWHYVDRWMYNQYAHIVCVSPMTKDVLTRYLNNETIQRNITIIPNGINLSLYRQAQPDEKIKEQYADKHIIVMVAAFRKQKDHKTLIHAMKQLPNDYVLLLAGEGECQKEHEREVASLALKDKVIFLGNCTNVPSLLATADVVVMSSHYEGLSLSSIEAMAVGTACIASDVPGLHEIVNGAGLLFPLGDTDKLRELIQQLCKDEMLRTQVSERCRQRAMQYGFANMIISYKQIYESFI